MFKDVKLTYYNYKYINKHKRDMSKITYNIRKINGNINLRSTEQDVVNRGKMSYIGLKQISPDMLLSYINNNGTASVDIELLEEYIKNNNIDKDIKKKLIDSYKNSGKCMTEEKIRNKMAIISGKCNKLKKLIAKEEDTQQIEELKNNFNELVKEYNKLCKQIKLLKK